MKFYLETFGCQMNVHDSERISWILSSEGYFRTSDPSAADLILLNTCSIREKAENKAYSRLGRLMLLKRSNPGLRIGILGCMAQREGEQILKRVKGVNFVIGPDGISRLPYLLRMDRETGFPQLDLEFTGTDPDIIQQFTPENPVKSFISIMKGCNNFCSYCIVPYVRGPETSRSPAAIIEEVTRLVERGHREVTLLGQNVNSYLGGNGSTWNFAQLLHALNDISGLERIRFTTSHPRDFNKDVADAMGSLEKVCEHLHLPLQAGSNRVLRAMNRGYTREEYLEKIDMVREQVTGIAITTDIIVGFPGEGHKEFARTLELLERVRFDSIFAFHFNKRPETRAYLLEETVSHEEKLRRLNHVNMIQKKISEELNIALVGSVQEVLVEGYSSGSSEMMSGRTRTNKVVNFPALSSALHTLRHVEIESASAYALRGAAVNGFAE